MSVISILMKRLKPSLSKREFLKRGLLGTGAILSGIGIPVAANPISTFLSLPEEKLWKWSKEGLYYTETPRGIKCLICPNECTLKENEISTCHNRTVKDNKLYTIAYGNPCAVHIDPVEKKPFYHFLPSSTAYSIATAGCNFACLNCQNWTISQVSPKETQNYDLMPERVVEECLKNKCESIAYTYSEPFTFYEYTLDTAILAREKGIKNILHSAGYINEEPLRNLCKHIDAVNIDLKSFKESIYLKLSAGKLQPVLNTLKVLKDEGVWLEITNLVVPGWTDDLDMIKEMCNWLYTNGFEDTPIFFSRFQPLYKLIQLPATPIATLNKAREIALDSGLKFVYSGNVPGSESENTSCPKCKKVLILRKGYSILENNISKGNCKFCGEKIPGVWS
jgi:pyruvate formate lyase activating enzyme